MWLLLLLDWKVVDVSAFQATSHLCHRCCCCCLFFSSIVIVAAAAAAHKQLLQCQFFCGIFFSISIFIFSEQRRKKNRHLIIFASFYFFSVFRFAFRSTFNNKQNERIYAGCSHHCCCKFSLQFR